MHLKFKFQEDKRMAKKSRWKNLPPHERFAKKLQQRGVSDETCEIIQRHGSVSKGTEE